MISAEMRDSALQYLASTDESCANARALQLYLEAKEKTILSMSMLDLVGTVQEKDCKARTSSTYMEWLEQYKDAVADFELQRNKRKRAELTIECWRSENANLRRGNI